MKFFPSTKPAVLAGLMLAFNPLISSGQVVINEMILKTSGGGADPEFVELFNTTGSPIDLTNWTIDIYDSEDSASVPPYGDSLFSVTIPSGTIPADGFFLLGTPEFQAVYSITPDVSIPDNSLPDDPFTMILRDGDSNTVNSTFITAGGANEAANDMGTPITPDIIAGPDATFTPAGYTLVPNGGTSTSLFGFFDPEPNPSATPMASTDNDPPSIVILIPANNAFLSLPPEDPLVAGFNETIVLGTGSITLYNAADDSVVEAFEVPGEVVSDPTGVGFIPTETLAPGSYYVLMSDTAVDDVAGNSFPGIDDPTVWSFTIASPAILDSSGPYTEDFSGFVSAETFPAGWTVSGDDLTYDGDWGTGTTGGFRGNASVLGYQHTGSTGILVETLTLRNDTGSTIENLTVSYVGRVARATEGRSPEFTVEVAGNLIPALAYSTSGSPGGTDNVPKEAAVTGLFIENGSTFTITWTSDRGGPGGASRQIGISDVSVDVGATPLPPSVAAVSFDPFTLTTTGLDVQSEVLAEGADAVTGMGFVYSETAVDADPEIGEPDVSSIIDPSPGVAPLFGTISGLTAGTDYTVRSYATNSIGTWYSDPLDFTTLPPAPSFTGTYMEAFDAFDGSFPAGWTGLTSGGSNGYGGDWGSGSSAGFRGGVSSPGVAGYQHTSSSGVLEVKLRLTNDTGAAITDLNIAYLGQVERVTQGRSPAWVVTLDGAEVPDLAYSTVNQTNQTLSASLTGLSIGIGEEFTLIWSCERGGDAGASKQIGVGEVIVSTSEIVADPYDSWALSKGLTSANDGNDDDAENNGTGDGIVNILEFILNGDPLAVDPSILPTVTIDETDFIFSFERLDDSEGAATAIFQWSSELSNFPEGNNVVIGAADSGPDANGVTVSILENGAEADSVSVRVPRSNATDGRIFGRLLGSRP